MSAIVYFRRCVSYMQSDPEQARPQVGVLLLCLGSLQKGRHAYF